MSAKHTTGPLIVHQNVTAASIRNVQGETIAVVAGQPNNLANARLFARSPFMRRNLEAAMAFLRRASLDVEQGHEADRLVSEIEITLARIDGEDSSQQDGGVE